MLRQEPVRLPASRDVAGEGADAGTINAVVGRVLASDAAGEWRAVTLDSIEDRLGARPVGLPELEADSIQIGTLDGAAVARLVYVIDGVPVELLQWASGSLNESVLADRDDRQANLQRARAAETEAAEAKAVAVVSPGAFRFSGIDFLLRGALPQDSLAALSLKVRSR